MTALALSGMALAAALTLMIAAVTAVARAVVLLLALVLPSRVGPGRHGRFHPRLHRTSPSHARRTA